MSWLEWSNRDGSFVRTRGVAGNYRAVSANLDGDRFGDLILYAPNDTWLWWGGINAADGYPRQGKQVALDYGPDAKPVPGRFFDRNRDPVYFYGPTTAADTFYRPQL